MSCIVKDTDTPIQITLCDDEGNPIDLDNIAGLIIEVFQEDIPFDKFSLNNQPGFRDIELVDATNGVLKIYLNADNTSNGVAGRDIYYEAKTQSVNPNFDSGTEDKSTGWVVFAI